MPRSNLTTYRKKRDFSKTAEPSGEARIAASKQPRFVIQKHAATRLHYDFRLEYDGVFKSWAVTRGPSLDPKQKRLAVETEDHPLDYGDFEGTIPKGQYGGGTVEIWDRGYWYSADPEKGFAKGDLKFALLGEKLKGEWVLVRMKGDRFGGKRTNWLLIKHRDEYSKERRRRGRAEGRPLGRLRPHARRDRSRQRSCAKAVHDDQAHGERGRGVEFKQGPCRRRARGIAAGDKAAQSRAKTRRRKKPRQRRLRKARPPERKCLTSSRRSFAKPRSGRRPGIAGFMRSNSTAIASRCASKTARSR